MFDVDTISIPVFSIFFTITSPTFNGAFALQELITLMHSASIPFGTGCADFTGASLPTLPESLIVVVRVLTGSVHSFTA